MFGMGSINSAELIGHASRLLSTHGAEIKQATGMSPEDMLKKAADLQASNPELAHKLQGLVPASVAASLGATGNELLSALHALTVQFLGGGAGDKDNPASAA